MAALETLSKYSVIEVDFGWTYLFRTNRTSMELTRHKGKVLELFETYSVNVPTPGSAVHYSSLSRLSKKEAFDNLVSLPEITDRVEHFLAKKEISTSDLRLTIDNWDDLVEREIARRRVILQNWTPELRDAYENSSPPFLLWCELEDWLEHGRAIPKEKTYQVFYHRFDPSEEWVRAWHLVGHVKEKKSFWGSNRRTNKWKLVTHY